MESSRGPETPVVEWPDFLEAFLDYYFPSEIREIRVNQFLGLQQGHMSVREYYLQFDSLAKYDPSFIDSMRESSRASGSQQQRGSGQMGPPLLRCDNNEHGHYERFQLGSNVCYACGQQGHMMRDCLNKGQGRMAQLSGSIAGSSSSGHSTMRGSQFFVSRGRHRGGASSSGGGQNGIYALAGHQDLESSPDVVTGTLTVCSYSVYAFLDPGSTLSYVTPFVIRKFDIVSESLSRLSLVSTPVGESVVAERAYRGCTVEIHSHQTSSDLIELEMVDFDAIMCMDWLASSYANVECWTKIFRFHFPGETVLECKGNTEAEAKC
ncbi:uncharacterized protein LOC132601452 [Lycium barbarum]|uniref:uncharacterized protein LOC132601452 n=1 Tax=Lycium barbarum TaxID=112863 RepID=UPI00293F5A3C|nr:uncharacterized protein LOC132601452 [Lycium barbarum]